jgi:hypothetical protein
MEMCLSFEMAVVHLYDSLKEPFSARAVEDSSNHLRNHQKGASLN